VPDRCDRGRRRCFDGGALLLLRLLNVGARAGSYHWDAPLPELSRRSLPGRSDREYGPRGHGDFQGSAKGAMSKFTLSAARRATPPPPSSALILAFHLSAGPLCSLRTHGRPPRRL